MRIRPLVFWPPFIVLCAGVLASFLDPDAFKLVTEQLNSLILSNFSWLFNVCALSLLGVCMWAFCSPFGRVRLGGPTAKPRLTTWQWFSVNLTTSVAIGILFWGPAEPLYHLASPPAYTGLAPNTGAAAVNAMAAMYMHWTFIPYAIYAAPALMFAFGHYNMRRSFSLSATLAPLLPRGRAEKLGELLDPICLYALATGMAASLGTGILTMGGGLTHLFGWDMGVQGYAWIATAIVVSYIASAASGLERGIAKLASLSSWVIICLAAFVLCTGPTRFILAFGVESFGNFLHSFFERSLVTGAATGDPWPQSWTVFYWAVWMAWAPISAVFLGQIAYGRTVRAFVMMNLILPALFSAVWMAIFSGTALHMELFGQRDLTAALQAGGAESAAFSMFANLPLAALVIPLFLGTAFLSFVSGADANTTAMAGISASGISPHSPEPCLRIKLLWGVVVGLAAWIMVSFAGVEGVKTLSNLGGFPVLFILLAVCVSLGRVIAQPQRYDVYTSEALALVHDGKGGSLAKELTALDEKHLGAPETGARDLTASPTPT